MVEEGRTAVKVGDEVREYGAFEAVIVEEGQRLGCTETCGSRGDGSGDDVLAKVSEFGADWRDEERILPRLMNTLSPRYFSAHVTSRVRVYSPPALRVHACKTVLGEIQ